MVNILLQKIKELEKNLHSIKQNNDFVKEEVLQLFKQCKIEKDKRELFKKRVLNIVSKLEIANQEFFYEKNALKYKSFIEIASNFKNEYLVILNVTGNNEKTEFVLGFLINKISPFFTLHNDKIIGLLDKEQLDEIKKLNTIPYFNSQTGEFYELEIFKVVFHNDRFNLNIIEKAKKIFEEFRKRPSFKNKHYIEYSLQKNKVVDFEKEKLNKEKEKYAYVYDEKYPNLESVLKREIKNIPFVLTLLERIDTEMEKIKESKGIENIVNRMLNYIEINLPEEEILEQVRYLRQKLLAK